MPEPLPPSACPFTPRERDYIRGELDLFFSTLPAVRDGFQVRTWRGGPKAGQPKVPPALRTLIERSLMAIKTDQPLPRAYFTERGMGALRLMAQNPRYMDPQKFAHVRAELGLTATGLTKQS